MTTSSAVRLRLVRAAALWLTTLLVAGCDKDECDDCAQDGGVSVAAEGPGNGDQRVVLFDGWRAGRCEQGLVCVGAPGVALGDVRWDLGCPSQMVAFASGSSPTEVEPPGAGAAPSVTMSPLVQLPIALHVVGSVGAQAMDAAVEEAMGDVREANRVFSLFGAGLELTYGGPDAIRRIGVDIPEGQGIQRGCVAATYITRHEGEPLIFDAGRVNVYFIPDFTFWGESGESCELDDGSLVFVRLTNDIYGKLGHEVGHALGLRAPYNGHSSSTPGFGPSGGNLMAMGVTEVTGITIGQSFRIQFDPVGWLQKHEMAPKLISEGGCESAFTRSPCPPMNLRPVRIWP